MAGGPFRFGVQVTKTGSGAEWRDRVRQIEDLGYSTLFMPDHFDEQLAPMPAMAMAAAHTTTLRIGALVFDNDYKHPATVAKEAATLDVLSDELDADFYEDLELYRWLDHSRGGAV